MCPTDRQTDRLTPWAPVGANKVFEGDNWKIGQVGGKTPTSGQTVTGYSTVIRENNLLTTLQFLGLEFEISLEVLVSSFTSAIR